MWLFKKNILDPSKKITRIECIIDKNERCFLQINFYHHTERLVAVGKHDDYVKKNGKRKEVFDIAEDEQIIGCELDESKFGNFCGMTWIKMKILKS